MAPLVVALSSAGTTDPDGSISTYSWDFGDGSELSTEANPSHTYATGTYVATLTVTDNEGGTNSATVGVRSNTAPRAVATADVTSGDGPLVVSFTGDTSSDADGTIATYLWDFGDGSSSSSANPTHSYAPGIWTATLTVTDNEGDTSTTDCIDINGVDYGSCLLDIDVNDPPTASISSNVSSGLGPLTVNFDSNVNDNDGSFSFSWDFGDGSAAVTNDLAPAHTFTSAGEYQVTLTVTDDRGSVATATRSITVTGE
jgi:PKD repeat protein